MRSSPSSPRVRLCCYRRRRRRSRVNFARCRCLVAVLQAQVDPRMNNRATHVPPQPQPRCAACSSIVQQSTYAHLYLLYNAEQSDKQSARPPPRLPLCACMLRRDAIVTAHSYKAIFLVVGRRGSGGGRYSENDLEASVDR